MGGICLGDIEVGVLMDDQFEEDDEVIIQFCFECGLMPKDCRCTPIGMHQVDDDAKAQ